MLVDLEFQFAIAELHLNAWHYLRFYKWNAVLQLHEQDSFFWIDGDRSLLDFFVFTYENDSYLKLL